MHGFDNNISAKTRNSILKDSRDRAVVAAEYGVCKETIARLKRKYLGVRVVQGEVTYVNGHRVATTEYRSWQGMKNRCLNPKAKDFRYYGKRGIKICERWLKFENFLADMGRKPTPQHTLERKNVNGNYQKRNCMWATRARQSQNRTDTRFSQKKVAKIRKLYGTGRYRQIDIAALFGTSQAAISQITRNAAWRE